jgi:hypothetical protein
VLYSWGKDSTIILNKARWVPVVSRILWKKEKPFSLLGIEPQCLYHPSWNPAHNDYAKLKLLAYLLQLQVLLL